MKSYGIDMEGGFLIQEIQSLPEFSSYDKGRFVYVIDDDNYYIGGLDDWYLLPIKRNLIKLSDLDRGPNLNQVNALGIPIVNRRELFENELGIEYVLENLATGTDIQNGAILTRHVGNNQIQNTHLLTNFSDEAVNAAALPCLDKVLDREYPSNSNIQDTIDNLINNCPLIVRRTLQLTVWEYNIVEELYMARVYYNPIQKDVYPLVQCYDESGNMLIPSKIITNKTSREVEIWTPYKLVMHVVVVG